MFTVLFILSFSYIATLLVSCLTNCLQSKKRWYDKARYIARHGTKKDMLTLCKGNDRFKGYSRLNKAELSQFILVRV